MRSIMDAIALVVHFSRRATEARKPDGIWPHLVEALVEATRIPGAAAIEITERGGVRLAAAKNVPLEAWEGEGEAIGSDLERQLLEACGGVFERATTLPIVSSGDLLGAVVLFLGGSPVEPADLRLAEGLADIAASAIERAHQHADLARSYAELRASRDALTRSEKLRALGQMAAGISHDLKGILNALSLPLQALEQSLPSSDERSSGLIASMERAITRGVDTVERLRNFSRQAPIGTREPADIDRLVHEAVSMCRARIHSGRARIELRLELGRPPPVSIHPSEFVTLMMNLVINAIEAFEKRGTISISTEEEQGEAVVRVEDDGPGMAPEVQERVFEPFFTTKGESGTGLGLAMVYATVQRHGGTITVDSAPGRGTTFVLRFPGAREACPESPDDAIADSTIAP